MPLVIIVGFPCTGKTVLSSQLRTYLAERMQKNCIVINEEGLGISKRNGYKGDRL